MLEALRNWAMTIAGIAVFGSICEIILPEGNFQKYIRLAIGLVLILSMVAPILNFSHINSDDSLFEVNSKAYEQRSEMEEKQQIDVIRLYKENLSQKIENSLNQDIKDDEFDVRCEVEESDRETFGSIKSIAVLIYANEDTDLTSKIASRLKSDYGISKEIITIRYLKE